ncbi:zinc-ribbon domain-containing protein [Sphingomonas sp.]|uniref:zinc ribbon domain-containing protein n=1 Tax=Sphingomonas sp. TaxID=28214 RepID=UPI0035C85902
MAFCTQCGTRLPDAARFCPRCGAPVPVAEAPAEEGGDRAAAPSSLPPEGLHFGPDPRSDFAGGRAEQRRATPPPPLTRAPFATEPVEDEDDGGTGTGTRLLVILALIAAAVLAIVFWQQREGARPVAESATNLSDATAGSGAEPGDLPSDAPTEIAAEPTPEPTPTPAPSVEVVQTGDEIGSTASLDPNGEAAIPAAAIDAAFADDPDRASEEFPGPVTVRGTVIGLLSDSPPALSLEGYQRGGIVVAALARGQRDAVELLSRGSVVRLRCASVRHQAGTTVLDGCRI